MVLEDLKPRDDHDRRRLPQRRRRGARGQRLDQLHQAPAGDGDRVRPRPRRLRALQRDRRRRPRPQRGAPQRRGLDRAVRGRRRRARAAQAARAGARHGRADRHRRHRRRQPRRPRSSSTTRSSGRSIARSPTSRRSSCSTARWRPRARSSSSASASRAARAAFTGPAIVFDDGAAAMAAIQDGTVKPGHVLVARGMGLKGGPGMAGPASMILFAVDSADLATEVAFVTDGQLSRPVPEGDHGGRGLARGRRRRPAGARAGRRRDHDRRRRAHAGPPRRRGRAGAPARSPRRARAAARRAAICRSTSAACSRCRRARCWSRTTELPRRSAPTKTATSGAVGQRACVGAHRPDAIRSRCAGSSRHRARPSGGRARSRRVRTRDWLVVSLVTTFGSR